MWRAVRRYGWSSPKAGPRKAQISAHSRIVTLPYCGVCHHARQSVGGGGEMKEREREREQRGDMPHVWRSVRKQNGFSSSSFRSYIVILIIMLRNQAPHAPLSPRPPRSLLLTLCTGDQTHLFGHATGNKGLHIAQRCLPPPGPRVLAKIRPLLPRLVFFFIVFALLSHAPSCSHSLARPIEDGST